jgi:hypothetical protein
MEKATGLSRSTLSWNTGKSKRHKKKRTWLAVRTLRKLATSPGLSENTRTLAREYLALLASAKTTNVPASEPPAKDLFRQLGNLAMAAATMVMTPSRA